MQTLPLLQKLSRTIAEHPDALPSIPWEDIALCLSEELSARPLLYSPQQRQALSEHLTETARQLTSKAQTLEPGAAQSSLAEMIGIARSLPSLEHYDAMMQDSLFDHAALRHYREDTTVVLGDSHTNFFSGNELLSFSPIGHGIDLCPPPAGAHPPFSVLHLGACLAYSCLSSDTSTHFREKKEHLLAHFIRPGARILVSLGEIDLRVHILPQAIKQDRPFQAVIDDVLERYLRFLLDLRERDYTVLCWGPIATQKDDSPQNPAYPRFGSEIERNRATAYFNDRLSSLCAPYDIAVLTIFPDMITDDFRTREEYLSSDHFHLSQRAMPLAEPLLRSAGLLS